MKSLYDVLGARADDDAEAIKNAFRAAVKANHPDLNPGDPDAVLRFEQIITVGAILRDEKQRAAYDQQLEHERQQIKLKLDQHDLRLQNRRRRTRLKLGAVAVAALCALAGGYGLVLPMLTTAIVEVMNEKPPTVWTATVVETIKMHDKVVAPVQEDVSDATPSLVEGAQAMQHAGGAAAAGAEAGDALKAKAAASAADKGDKGSDAFALADREPALAPPNDRHFYRELGIASYRIGDFPRAIVNLDVAIGLDPGDAEAYNIRGNAWDEIGVFDNALADYDAAIRIDPNNPVFFHDRAIMWHRRGNLDKALVDLDRAIRFTFSDPNIYCDRGLLWYEKGSHARAAADFNHAVKIDRDFATAYISRGLILHRNSEFSIAFADLGRTIRVSSSVFDVSRQRAEIGDHGPPQGQFAPVEVTGHVRRRNADEAAVDFHPGGGRDPAVSQHAGHTGVSSGGGVRDSERRATGRAVAPSESNTGRRSAHRIVPHPAPILDTATPPRDTRDPEAWSIPQAH